MVYSVNLYCFLNDCDCYVTDVFDLAAFAVSCVVSRKVIQLLTCVIYSFSDL